MSGADESSPDTSPTLFDMAMYEVYEASMLPTPNAADAGDQGGHRFAHQDSLAQRAIRGTLWPTPNAGNWGSSTGHDGNRKPYLAQMVQRGLNPSTSSAADSPASPSATPDSARATQTSVGSGLSLGASFAKLLPDGSWLRTYPGSFPLMGDDYSEVFSQTWPRSGSMRSGTVSELPTSAPRTYGSGSSSWHTPNSFDANTPKPSPEAIENTLHRGHADQTRRSTYGSLGKQLLWPSPQEEDSSNVNPNEKRRDTLAKVVGHGALNADWVSLLMGFPKDWTDVAAGNAESQEPPRDRATGSPDSGDSATPSSPRSRSISEG